MRVLIIQGVADSLLVSGEETVIQNDIFLLKQKGVEVIYKKISIPRSGFISFLKKASALTWSFENYKKIIKWSKNYKPNVIHFHSIIPYLSISVLFASKKCQIPVVQTLHNGRWLCIEGAYYRNKNYCDDCVGSYGIKGFYRSCKSNLFLSFLLFLNNFIMRKTKILFKFVDKFIAVSDFVREQHLKSKFPDEKILVRNNSFFFSRANPNLPVKKKNGVCFAGRISEAKGSDILHHLVKNVDFDIHIIGNGPGLDLFKNLEKKYSNVKVLGRLSNIETLRVVKASRITIIPSQCGDSFPSIAIESLSQGTPIVASNIGGLSKIVKDSKAGILIDPDDRLAFVDNVKELINDENKLQIMANNGIEYVQKKINSEKQINQLIEIYEEVI